MAKNIDMYQLRKKLKTVMPELDVYVWTDAMHANVKLPNYSELKLEKNGSLTVSADLIFGSYNHQPIESKEFTDKIAKTTGLNLEFLNFDQLVKVITAMMELKPIQKKSEKTPKDED